MHLKILIVIYLSCSLSYGQDLIRYYNGELKLDPDEVLAMSEETIKNEPSNYLVALAHFQKAIILRNDNQNFKAYETYDKAWEKLDGSDTTDHYLAFSILRNQGAILIYLGYLKEAAEKHEQALPYAYEYSVNSALSVKLNLGIATAKFDPEKALKTFDEIITEVNKLLKDSLSEKNRKKYIDRQAKVYDEIGKMFLNSGEYDEAVPLFKKAVELAESKTTRARALHNLSQVYLYKNDLPLQRQYLIEALSLKKGEDRFVSLMDLGENLIKSGNMPEGIDTLVSATNYYEDQALEAKSIKIFEILAEAGIDTTNYYRIGMIEYKRLSEQQSQVEELLKQQAMKQLLIRLDVEKQKKKKVKLYSWLAVAGFALAGFIVIYWRVWFNRLRRRIANGIKERFPEFFH